MLAFTDEETHYLTDGVSPLNSHEAWLICSFDKGTLHTELSHAEWG
jgi:hypothetical protein